MPVVKVSPAFKRSFKRYITKRPELKVQIAEIITQLELDPRATWLKTHKLRGEWQGYLACSAGYDLRIVFEFIENEPEDDILLIDIGTHNDVY